MHQCIFAIPFTTPHYLFASMIFNEAAIVLFCDELKTYGDFTYSNRSKRVTEHMMIGFNHELLTNLILSVQILLCTKHSFVIFILLALIYSNPMKYGLIVN